MLLVSSSGILPVMNTLANIQELARALRNMIR
ncbi:phage baseplate assembly protein V, partial [Escherichia coli]|nr:phage baseplate assembly protein V [Escherichia coli]